MKLCDVMGELIATRALSDQRIIVLDGDLADSDGAARFAERLPERFLACGIAEQNMVSLAAGLATTGRRPFVFSFAAFLCFRALDQIRVSICQCNQPVTLVGAAAGGWSGRNGQTHTALNDLALMLSLPGMSVWAPADRADVDRAVNKSLKGQGPAYIRLPRGEPGELPRSDNKTGVRWLSEKRSACIISTGLASHWATAAFSHRPSLAARIGILHCPEVSDTSAIERELATVRQAVTLEDHYSDCGFGSRLQAKLGRKIADVIGWPATFLGQSGSEAAILTAGGFAPHQLASRIERAFKKSRGDEA